MPFNVQTAETLGGKLKTDLDDRLATTFRMERMPSGNFEEVHHSAKKVFVPQGVKSLKADLFAEDIHTTGRRSDVKGFCRDGIAPFATPLNETLTESPAVFCGYTKPGEIFTETETFKRNYGDIFNPSSTGFIVLLNPAVMQTTGYERDTVEARIKTTATPNDAVAIIVGNDSSYLEAVNAVRTTGLKIPVILLEEKRTPA